MMDRLTERTEYGIVGNNKKVTNYPLYKVAEYDELDHGITGQCFEKLAEYEDLEEQGLLLRLPCHIGDIIYEPTNRNTINEYRVTGIKKEAFALWIEWKLEKGFVYQSIYGVEVGEIGKTVFLTKAEAEQKLKEMESE